MSDSSAVIVCPACGQKNKIDASETEKKPVCGKCHNPLPLGGPIEVSDDDFDQTVLKSTLPVLVDFWAPWCGPCRMVGPVVEQLAHEYAGRVIVAKVNTDNNRGIAGKFKIMGIPTLMLFKNGEIVERITGAVPKSNLDDVLRKHLQDA